MYQTFLIYSEKCDGVVAVVSAPSYTRAMVLACKKLNEDASFLSVIRIPPGNCTKL